MQRVTCSFCGLPFSVRKVEPGASYFCCSGCALASRIPFGQGGTFPVSAGLVTALAFGFGLFNQALFAVLGLAVAGEGRPEVGANLQLVSCLIGIVLSLVGVAFSLLPRGRSAGDVIVSTLVLGAVAWLGWVTFHYGAALTVKQQIGVNLVLAIWTARGWAWRAAMHKKDGSSDLTG